MKKKVALHNLGCKVNAYELEAMQEMLAEAGYEIVPFAPGAIGVFVHWATEQAQSGSTSVSTKGWSPVLVMVYCTVTGCFHSIWPKLYISVFEVKRACATAVNTTLASTYKVINIRFIYFS